MNSSRTAWKVGMFVAIGLLLMAALMLNFSKGVTLFQPTYQLHVIMPNVSGLKPNAGVMMAGVPIGTVVSTALSKDGKSVDITVSILSKYNVYPDSKIYIDSLGFLGDQYIAVTPPDKIDKPPLKHGDRIYGEAPFSLQAAVQTTSELLEQARYTMRNLDQAITNVNRTILNEKTLSDFELALRNLNRVTEDAVGIARDARILLNTNAPAANAAISNLNVFSQKMDAMANKVNETIESNRANVTAAVQNFRDVSTNLKQTSDDLRAGKGLAGTLLYDEQIKGETAALVNNANVLAYNLSLFSSNLNQKGLWAMLRKPKEPVTNGPAAATPRSWPWPGKQQ